MTSTSFFHSVFFRFLTLFSILSVVGYTTPSYAQDLLGRLTAGYRGKLSTPPAGKVSSSASPLVPIEVRLWPYTQEYALRVDNNLSSITRGSHFFTQAYEDTTNIHLRWLKQYGIDGIAVLRPVSEIGHSVPSSSKPLTPNRVLTQVQIAAEARGITFFVMYDLSSKEKMTEVWLPRIKDDFSSFVDSVAGSRSWALEDYRPVVGIRGIGLNDPGRSVKDYIELITFLKRRGYYVVGGVSDTWRTQTRLASVFKELDMIMPWSVGVYSNTSSANKFAQRHYKEELEWTRSRGIDYMPVIWPGIEPQKQSKVSRNQGKFLWRQFYNLFETGHDTAYIASLDGYDDATAILKAASDSSMTPENYSASTLSSEGKYVAPDYYLRLAGAGARMIRGQQGISKNVPILASQGPLWFRTGFEKGLDAIVSWKNKPLRSKSVGSVTSTSKLRCAPIEDPNSHEGSGALKIDGNDQSNTESYVYFQTFDVNIPINLDTILRYWKKPENSLGRYVNVDLLATDGSTLRNTMALDREGRRVPLNVPQGMVGKWNEVQAQVGHLMQGKTIDKILVSYDHGPETGSFSALIDDIEIIDGTMEQKSSTLKESSTYVREAAADAASKYIVKPEPVTDKYIVEPIPEDEYSDYYLLY